MSRYIPKTKIIATLGPASSTRAVLRNMINAGLDIVRLNFSHGTCQEHTARVEIVRGLNRAMRRAVKIMQDLEGYRIRIGKLESPVELREKNLVCLTKQRIKGAPDYIPFDYDGPFSAVKKGYVIYIDDGRISLKVVEVDRLKIRARVVSGGVLTENKGVNIPEADLKFPVFTDKDKRDIVVAEEYKLDYIAQSFVRNAKDLRMLKDFARPERWGCKVFAKVESRDAIENIDEIISEADGIIVARGDLGICVPVYKVPVIQKKIVNKCLSANKPVVVATQMLDSMIKNSIPTRAEVSDVANAIFEGATHLLLSGETAIGKNPRAVVDIMNKIIKYTEKALKEEDSFS